MKLDAYITSIGDYPDDPREGCSVNGRLVKPGAPIRDFCFGGAFAFRVSDAAARRYRVGERLTVTIVKKRRSRCRTD